MSNYTTLGKALRAFLELIVEAVAAPRRTQALVGALTLADLEDFAADEPLPYRNESVRALVWELKYQKNPQAAKLAGAYLAQQLLSIAAEEIGKPLLIPVPMHEARRKERGYNQTEFLLEAASAELVNYFEYDPQVLARTRATVPQQGLPKYIRLKNVKNSMKVTLPEKIKGRVCVVVDDVTTTGATLKECGRALRDAGAMRVHAVALARS